MVEEWNNNKRTKKGSISMNEVRKVDIRDSVKTVTSNNFISAKGLETLSLKARKMLYIAISQCRMTDETFFVYSISAKEFAEIMEISPQAVYAEADKITNELIRGILQVSPKGEERFKKYALFSMCEYEHGILRFKLNPDMTSFLLRLKGDFSKPLLSDFLKMRSTYSIAIWHLMQREMKSQKPYASVKIEFDLMLSELREVTGTQKKLKQLGQFKEKCFEKALQEIHDICGVEITYTNIKKGRTVVGFHCTAVSLNYIDEKDLPQELKDRIRLGQLRIESNKRVLTIDEKNEVEQLEQIEMMLNFR